MQRFSPLTLCLISFLSLQCAQAPDREVKTWDQAHHIVFLGNSITYAGSYVNYVEAYWKLKHPDMKAEFINLGLSSETVSGLSEPNHAKGKFPRPDLRERLDRALTLIQPDLIFACYGMNDGIYLPFDEDRFSKFQTGIHHLHERALEAGAEIIHLTPPVYDERKGVAYAEVMNQYADWLIQQQDSAGWKTIDIHWPMQKSLENERKIDSSFAYARDGIHPNQKGHWVMAKEVLKYLGAGEVTAFNSAEEAFAGFRNGEELLALIQQRQAVTKHAYLSEVGHHHPHIKAGLPLPKAQQKIDSISHAIQELLIAH